MFNKKKIAELQNIILNLRAENYAMADCIKGYRTTVDQLLQPDAAVEPTCMATMKDLDEAMGIVTELTSLQLQTAVKNIYAQIHQLIIPKAKPASRKRK